MSYLLFKRGNDLGGWIVFLIAAFVYGMTIEPTASFWDCPEFISCAEKLQVGHPPGAPFYMPVSYTHLNGTPVEHRTFYNQCEQSDKS